MTTLVHAALRNRLLVMVLFAVACIAGVIRLQQLPVDAFPDTTPVQVQINTVAPALSPEEIEQQITLPVELSIGGLPGLESVRSVSKFGFSQVVVTFDDHTPIIDARQYTAERLASAELPDGVGRPTLGPIATGLGEVFHYIVRSTDPDRSIEDLRTLHDWVIKPELRKVAGVAEVNSWGGLERQFHVVADPAALIEFDFTLNDLVEALERNNANVGGGQITSAGEASVVRGISRVSSIEQIGDIVIAAADGAPVRVRDVASVEIGSEIRRGAVSAGGQGEVVLGLAFMLMGENSHTVTADLRDRLDAVRPSLPDDIVVEGVYDRTSLVDQVIETVKHNLVVAAVLVLLVLFALLGNLRAGLLVAVSIPIAMVFAAQGMIEFAIAASLLSLGAIDFGIVVDGSIIVVENAVVHLAAAARGRSKPLSYQEAADVVLGSTMDVRRAALFGEAIIVLVYVPLLTLAGHTDRVMGVASCGPHLAASAGRDGAVKRWDLRAGRCMGACLEYAARVGMPLMLYVFSDGSVSSNGRIDDSMDGRGKGEWTGDNQQTAASFFLVYNPAGRPTPIRRQIGFMRSDASVETASSPAANNVNQLVQTVLLNYMALHGEQGDFGTRFNGHGLGNGTSQDSLIAFSNVVNGTIGN